MCNGLFFPEPSASACFPIQLKTNIFHPYLRLFILFQHNHCFRFSIHILPGLSGRFSTALRHKWQDSAQRYCICQKSAMLCEFLLFCLHSSAHLPQFPSFVVISISLSSSSSTKGFTISCHLKIRKQGKSPALALRFLFMTIECSQSVHSIVSQLLFRSPRSPVLLRLTAILFLWDSA